MAHAVARFSGRVRLVGLTLQRPHAARLTEQFMFFAMNSAIFRHGWHIRSKFPTL
jgi:hypothetical protein